MKKCIAFIAGILLCITVSCGNKTNGGSGQQDSDNIAAVDTIAVETFHYDDSTKYAGIDAVVSLPVGEGAAVQLMRDSLIGALDRIFAYNVEGERLVKPFTNPGADIKTILSYYCKPALKYMSNDAQSIFADMDGDCEPSGNDVTLTKTYEDACMVVFTETGCYMASGAAHPSSCAYTFTFNKQTGQLVSQFFKLGSEKKMQKLLVNGLLQYFKECGEDDVNAKNLKDYLQLPETSETLKPSETPIIPLPQFAPTPDKDGLCFTYQQYEIACYAAGMPSFIIPYKDLQPYLTDEAKALLK